MTDATHSKSPKEHGLAPVAKATPAVDIAMPCYNCARWLDASVSSLLAQEDAPPWRLIVRDDASTDDTPARLAEWQSRLGGRMVVLEQGDGRGRGPVSGFNAVLSATEAPWVMTCDPDDVWLPRRVAITLRALQQAEDRFGSSTPLAVCSDARVVDGTGKTVAASFWRWTRQNPRHITRPVDVAMESVALGSTMAVNRALVDISLPISIGATYQDTWLALAAAAFGRLIALPDKLVLYRRHLNNISQGLADSSLPAAAWRAIANPAEMRRQLHRIVLENAARQATAFTERYRGRLMPSVAADIDALGSLPQRGFFGRRATLLRRRLRFGSPLKTAGMWLLL